MNEYIECLTEMATVRPNKNFETLGILLAVNPDDNHSGDPYFKVYDSSSFYTASKVWRIKFTEPVFIKKHIGKIPASTEMNSSEKKKLVEYLKLPSKDFKGYTVWDELRYRWNIEKDLMNQFGFEDYVGKRADLVYKNNPDYVPYNIQMPDYMKL